MSINNDSVEMENNSSVERDVSPATSLAASKKDINVLGPIDSSEFSGALN